MKEIIKELIRNNEDLHYPYLVLSNGERVKVSTYYLNEKYQRKDNLDLDLIGRDFDKEDYFVFCQKRARIELLPIVKSALKEDKRYSKLSLTNKGYYEILKKYDLIKELKESERE
jgi:hypothetical protein